MRPALIALCTLAVAAALAVGVRQAREGAGASVPQPLSLAEVSKPIAGAPPQLAALRRRVNVLQGGGTKAFDAQLRALRGHPVVVNMWASWCGPCRIELPHFQREAVARGAEVAFFGVNVADNREDALKLAARYPMPYPSFVDRRLSVAGEYGARGLPATAFYDASGKRVLVHQGPFTSEDQLAAQIDRYALGRG